MIEQDYTFQCPHCWDEISIRLDPTAGKKQTFSYDCEICCRAISITVEFEAGGVANFSAQTES